MKTLKKLEKTLKCVGMFFKQTWKNYKSMKTKIKKIWACLALIIIATAWSSCNVTREITNRSEYFQKGDTTVTIQTKTIETYNAQKK